MLWSLEDGGLDGKRVPRKEFPDFSIGVSGNHMSHLWAQ